MIAYVIAAAAAVAIPASWYVSSKVYAAKPAAKPAPAPWALAQAGA